MTETARAQAATKQVLHIDLIALKHGADKDGLLAAAEGLKAIESVTEVGVIEAETAGDFDVGVFFVLRDFTALEPFGTNPDYVRFLQGTVAPLLKGFAGADVTLEDDMPAIGAFGACLAAAAPPQTYDWEVRERLDAWRNGRGVLGLAAGERQRYRGLALVFGDQPIKSDEAVPGFETALIAGHARRLS